MSAEISTLAYGTSLLTYLFEKKNLTLQDKIIIANCYAGIPLLQIPIIFKNPNLFKPIPLTHAGITTGLAIGLAGVRFSKNEAIKILKDPSVTAKLRNLLKMLAVTAAFNYLAAQFKIPLLKIATLFMSNADYSVLKDLKAPNTAAKMGIYFTLGVALGFLLSVIIIKKKKNLSWSEAFKVFIKGLNLKTHKTPLIILGIGVLAILFTTIIAKQNTSEQISRDIAKFKSASFNVESNFKTIFGNIFKEGTQLKDLLTKDDYLKYTSAHSNFVIKSDVSSLQFKAVGQKLDSLLKNEKLKMPFIIVVTSDKSTVTNFKTNFKNAFATTILGQGIIVMTNELFSTLTTDEVVGVLLHEIGHLQHMDMTSILTVFIWSIFLASYAKSNTAKFATLGYSAALTIKISNLAEMSADKFAVQKGYGSYLSSALAKMKVDRDTMISNGRVTAEYINLVEKVEAHGSLESRIKILEELGKKIY